jgi:hypothetical protein
LSGKKELLIGNKLFFQNFSLMPQLDLVCFMPLWWRRRVAAVMYYQISMQILVPSYFRSQKVRALFR